MQSCRGARGAAHSKIYLFSKTGKAKNVVMSGSANLTVAGAVNQWNDMYTWVDNREIYKFAVRVYKEMWQDTPVPQQFVQFSSGKDLLGLHAADRPRRPHRRPGPGPARPGDVRRCEKTKHGRTIIRAAPDVMRNERGMAIAAAPARAVGQGCDVRIAYTVMGVDVFRFLGQPTARGVVPKKHLVQDFDGDGEFDNYFHLKALTINGVFDGNPASYVDPQRLVELVGLRGRLRRELRDPDATRADDEVPAVHRLLVRELPEEQAPDAMVARVIAAGRIDPYANVDMD